MKLKLDDICINPDYLQEEIKTIEVNNEDIAIVGMSVNLPSGDSIDEYWNNLKNGEDGVNDLSCTRKNDIFNFLQYKQDISKIDFQKCGFLSEIDKFDNSFFNISPTEAKLMSPLHRLHMEVIWRALEDYGYSEGDLDNSNIGIFSGIVNDSDIYYYRNLIKEYDSSLLKMGLSGNLYSMIASRISYYLNLKGSALMIDTACSSSMSAIISAIESLKSGHSSVAIATGGKIIFSPVKDESEMIGIESSDDKTRAFDDKADGSAFGEGILALVLKPIKDAKRDNDKIYGLIKGYSINQDGKTMGITVPSVDSQCDVIRKSLKSAGILAEDISYFEAHGTGTNIGDSIEISGIEKAFSSSTDKKTYCAIGSVKSNIGHLYGASGITSVIKCLLAIKNSVIPPNINFVLPNRKIDFIDSPIYINTKPRTWEVQGTKKCCVSNFGISGTNCNIIIEEFKKKKKKNIIEQEKVLITFSAKSKNSFELLLKKYINFLSNNKINLNDLSYSTLVRRNHFSYRLILLVSSIEEVVQFLKYALHNYENGMDKENIYYGDVKNSLRESNEETEKLLIYYNVKKDINILEELCKLYVEGYKIKWKRIFNDDYEYIDLPSYPYNKKRYWIDALKKKKVYYVEEKKEDIIDEIVVDKIESKNNIISGKDVNKLSKEEIVIGNIWCNVLGFDEVSVKDNYFEMGGDSILGIKIINGINEYFGINISVSSLLQRTSIEELAEYILEIKESKQEKIEVIEKVEEEEYYNISSSQMRIFLLEQIEANRTKYNIYSAYKVHGDLDVKKLENALNVIIDRHEVLRSEFTIVDGVPKQKVLPSVNFSIETEECVENIEELIKKFVRKFDVSKPPLMRTLVGNLKDNSKIFLFDMHHLVTDGTSFDNLIKEMESLYNGKELEQLKIQYKDYSNYYNKLLLSSKLQKQEKYWLEKFKENIPVLNLQTSYERKNISYTKGNKFFFKIENDLYSKLNDFALKNNATPFMITITALYILLYKHSNDEEICIGTPTSGRINSQLDNLIGVFINTLVLKNFINNDISFAKLLNNIKQVVLEAFDNAEYGYETLVEKLRVNRDISRNPLFDVMFIYQNLGDKSISFNGTEFIPYNIETVVPKYDLTLELLPKVGEIICNFEYCSELFSPEYIEFLSTHYINILEQIICNKNIQVKDINVIGNEEKDKIIDLGKGYVEEIEETVINKFIDLAARDKDKIAITFEDKSITYGELDVISNKIANNLLDNCESENMIFPVVMDRSIELIGTLLGVLKIGGSYIPIDPEYPNDRIDYILKDSNSKFILTTTTCQYDNSNIKRILIDEVITRSSIDTSINNSCLDGISYIIYTSGSTGNPKGVMVRHREMVNFVQGVNRINEFTMNSKVLCVTTISFDIFVLECFVPLCYGAEVILANELQTNDVDKMSELITRTKLNIAQFTPSRAQMILMLEHNAKVLKQLDTIFIGGEAFPEDLLIQLKKYTNARIINMYGPTETTVWSTFKDLTNELHVSIGKPIDNTNIYIINEENNLQYLGGSGEIAIGGLGVTKGYVNNVELTNSKFIKSNFNDDFIYKTGDLGKWVGNGNLYHMGRMDNQVKVRGYRVELGEIEEVILKYPKVLNCAVITKEIRGILGINAFIMVSGDFIMEELKEFIQSKLPAYMIPSSINIIEAIPMTANGKLDRKQLEDYEITIDEVANLIEPRTVVEKEIYKIWTNVLGNENIGVTNKFFEVGGNSLLLISTLKSIKEVYQTNISSADLFKLQSISSIANYIENEKKSKDLYYKYIIFPDIFISNNRSGQIDVSQKSISFEQIHNISNNFNESFNEYEISIGIYIKMLSVILKNNHLGFNICKNINKYIVAEFDLDNIQSIEQLMIKTKESIDGDEFGEEFYHSVSKSKKHLKILINIDQRINVDKEIKKFNLIINLKKFKDNLNIEYICDTKLLNKNAVRFMIDNYIAIIEKYGGK